MLYHFNFVFIFTNKLFGFLIYFLSFLLVLPFSVCCIFFLSCHTMWLAGPWFIGQGQVWLAVGALRSSCWTNRELQGSGNINWLQVILTGVNFRRVSPSPVPQPGSTQLPANSSPLNSSAGATGQTTSKTGGTQPTYQQWHNRKFVADEEAKQKPTRPNKMKRNR